MNKDCCYRWCGLRLEPRMNTRTQERTNIKEHEKEQTSKKEWTAWRKTGRKTKKRNKQWHIIAECCCDPAGTCLVVVRGMVWGIPAPIWSLSKIRGLLEYISWSRRLYVVTMFFRFQVLFLWEPLAFRSVRLRNPLKTQRRRSVVRTRGITRSSELNHSGAGRTNDVDPRGWVLSGDYSAIDNDACAQAQREHT